LIFYQVPIENKQEFKWGIKIKTDKKYPAIKSVGFFLMEKIGRLLSWSERGLE
jgi:hypothetical protein